jgi:sterol desaturase/sphingolipid hydroxylase (fatty acid hydroxylase superfamily)
MVNLEDSEGLLRLFVFLLVCIGLIGLEVWRPRRGDANRRGRWPVNLALGTVNAVVVRLIAPASGVTFALWGDARGFGLARLLNLPELVEFAGAVLALDLLVYAQHRLFHAVPALWSLHRLHHADRAMDVTTGIRFHPAEIAISTVYKGVCIVALGASPGATVTFELLLSLGSLFSHSNVRIGFDRLWQVLFVTPDMHRVHHSTEVGEQNTNFGFSLSCWDRMCGTYRAQPANRHETMPLGVVD